RARSADMATKNYFDHVQPDGHMVFDFISASGITWYGAGEVIAWNTWPTLFDSADAANTGWLGSPTHRAIILSADYNYIGIGLAVQSSTGKKFWTAVTIKGPDRTRGWANMARVVRSRLAPVDGKVPVWIRWEGADRRLQVLTSGLRYFQVERRIDGGSWALIRSATTSTTATLYQSPHHRYDYRVRMRDRAGNWGLWSAPFAISI
ncbi:MAG: CAP domain-containing protein, partial [Myxococcales bacterium]